jgi:hypothetical protein
VQPGRVHKNPPMDPFSLIALFGALGAWLLIVAWLIFWGLYGIGRVGPSSRGRGGFRFWSIRP